MKNVTITGWYALEKCELAGALISFVYLVISIALRPFGPIRKLS